MRRITFCTVFAMILLQWALPHTSIAEQAGVPISDFAGLRRAFASPPDDSRIMMRWWWFGPAISNAQLEKELMLMKEGGIGGFEVQPVYPLTPDDTTSGIVNRRYLDDGFLSSLRFVAEKARSLGLRMDLTLGSGWPYGGPDIPITRAAGKLRCERIRPSPGARRIPLPFLSAGERLIAVFEAKMQSGKLDAGGIRELTQISDNILNLPEGASGDKEILSFIASRTGMMVKRPSVGAEGFVLDHYDRGALDIFLNGLADRLMRPLAGIPPYSVFCDSLEVFGSDWTGDFLDEFRKRRGYELKPYLPALVEDVGENTASIRYDWGRTLTELAEERFIAPLQAWATGRHTRLRMQCYGMPPVTLASNALVDLPEGEGPQWKIVSASRWASSASHLFNRPVTSSETWTWLHSPVFRATPLDMKAEADLHFLQGINQLIGHGWPYTPDEVEYPGWRFYAAAVFNEKNPWWLVMPDLSLYMQRVSFMLRQGTPCNDVALYLPVSDAWAGFSAGKVHMIDALREKIGPAVIAEVLENGYNLDFVDDGSIAKLARIAGRELLMGANRYKIIILPGVERIPLQTYLKLEEFVRGGGILVATRRFPGTTPGLKSADKDNRQVAEISTRLFETDPARALFVREEKSRLGAVLKQRLKPDVDFSSAAADIGFIHRRADSAEIYFVANTSNRPQRTRASFRQIGKDVEVWNPRNGAVTVPSISDRGDNVIGIDVDLEPYGSRIFVFAPGLQKAQPPPNPKSPPAPIDLSSGWNVTFGKTAKPVLMQRPESWTNLEDYRFYSGQATYEKTVDLPQDFISGGWPLVLDFGEGSPLLPAPLRNGMQAWLDAPVREAAVVFVNEQRAGSVWCPPYSIEITKFLKSGDNRIRIIVGNLAVNHMAGRPLPDYRLLNLRYGTRFEPQDMDKIQALPSGLLGPIRILSKSTQ